MRSKWGYKYILFLTIFCQFALTGCSSNDGDEDISNSFFEVNNGTKWEYFIGANQYEYLKFNNNRKKYLEYWYIIWDDNCHLNYMVNNDAQNGGIFKILENSKDELVIKMNPNTRTRFTVEGDILTIVEISDNVLFEDQVRHYDRAYDAIENLKHCNE